MRRLVVLAIIVACTASVSAGDWKFKNSDVYQQGQPENWMCGPTTMAMWLGSIRSMSYDPYAIARQYASNDGSGTSVSEFFSTMDALAPSRYAFAEYTYVDQQAGVKSLMNNIAIYREPVAIVVLPKGSHWLLVRGGRANKNPSTNYPKAKIKGVYVNDSTENSPVYSRPVTGMYSHKEYSPSKIGNNWWKIGKWGDRKFRAVMRSVRSDQGKTIENNDRFASY